jgi:peptidoglycan/xylan/chitin deacetylase (PgdA/CDA1 family)
MLMRAFWGAPVILMYHGVTREAPVGLLDCEGKHVPESLFIQQLKLLVRSRQVVSLPALIAELTAGRPGRGMVALTFDDGYLNNLECAAPVLAELKLPATFFLATGLIGGNRWAWVDRLEVALHCVRRGSFRIPVLGQVTLGELSQRADVLRRVKAALKAMSWSDAETLVAEIEAQLKAPCREPWGVYRFMTWNGARELAHAGFDLGAHTVNHAILSRVDPIEAEFEIHSSRAQVWGMTGRCSPIFCYPNGKRQDYTREVIEICRRAFSAALSTEPGRARREELYELRRVPVDANTSERQLAALLAKA